MSDYRDPAIKLFGMTIPLHASREYPSMNLACSGSSRERIRDDGKDAQEKKTSQELKEQVPEPSVTKETSSTTELENLKSSSSEAEEKTINSSTTEETTDNPTTQKEKCLKKPDKILPCPRCNSMDTKFCYYNNYNVNQPRYFCKNCQRYWTAGGTMRNVPVGAGRRKNKNSAAFYRHISLSDPTLQASTRADVAESPQYPLKPNGTVLRFGSDTPLCESMASVLNLAAKTLRNGNRNGHHSVEEKAIESSGSTENYIEKLNSASATNSNATTVPDQNNPSTPPSIPIINGRSWAYTWPPTTAYCPPSVNVPFYPAAAYWTCAVPHGNWGGPWFSPIVSSSNATGPSSPTLGKHSRDDNVLQDGSVQRESNEKENHQERRIWVPKTLRIDDPHEAAKSSIWAMIGTKNDASSAKFDAFQAKAKMKKHGVEASPLLRSNPAALARSVNFQEGS